MRDPDLARLLGCSPQSYRTGNSAFTHSTPMDPHDSPAQLALQNRREYHSHHNLVFDTTVRQSQTSPR